MYRFARTAAEAERISAEFAGRNERVVIIRWQEPDETGRDTRFERCPP